MPKFAAVSTWCRNGCLFRANASLAQLARARDFNLGVVGSNPTRGSKELKIDNDELTILIRAVTRVAKWG